MKNKIAQNLANQMEERDKIYFILFVHTIIQFLLFFAIIGIYLTFT